MKTMQSAERVSHADASDNFVYRRSLLAYQEAARRVSGSVLEIGTGSGYGARVIAPHCSSFLTVDKFDCGLDVPAGGNVTFRRMQVPPLEDIADGSMDFVVSFQVIEHVRREREVLREVHRVLRPGGCFIVSTPNAVMSLTRNPWHVREYTCSQLHELLASVFRGGEVEMLGVFGNEKVAAYYEKNRRSVQRITRFDLLRLQWRLPGWMLRLPYDVLNRMNRRRLLRDNSELTLSITEDDYFLAPASAECFDLFAVARKM